MAITPEERFVIFSTELSVIKDPQIKNFGKLILEALPEYFFSIPASSSGKYHPQFSAGDGGLVRHTKAVARWAVELGRLDWWVWKEREFDLCIAAILGHDGFKSGWPKEEFTRADHPLVAVKMYRENEALTSALPPEEFELVMGLIAGHMGQWNTDYRSAEELLPKPRTRLQKFVHLCDYLASRKLAEVNFMAPVKRDF